MDFTEVCRNIRSCLNSSKSQLSVTQLNRDYNEVLGENIPYRKVGYSSLEALIRAVPNIRISSIRGELFIDVKPDEKTAHIASLVREQRTGKKKKKKSSRGGLYRGSIAPPRRPVSMPSAPPRRSAPPSSYQSDYKRNVSSDYNNRRRDSPPEQSYQSQRRPNPSYQSDSQYSRQRDSQKSTDNYYSRRRDPSPTPPSSGNYYSSRRRDPSPPRQSSYSNHRNSDTIEISSDEDTRIENITRKYRSHPSQYDFSDPNEFDDDDCSDFDDCDEINNKMEELKVTRILGEQRKVSINKPAYRSYPSNNSNDDDYGYSSMKINSKVDSRRPFYRTPSSDSYDDDVYDSSSTTTTTTTTDRLDSTDTNGYSSPRSTQQNIRRPFGRATLLNGYKAQEAPRIVSRGRGYRVEPVEDTCRGSTTSESSTVVPSDGDIKVTVPNGSGRARVVAFLLR